MHFNFSKENFPKKIFWFLETSKNPQKTDKIPRGCAGIPGTPRPAAKGETGRTEMGFWPSSRYALCIIFQHERELEFQFLGGTFFQEILILTHRLMNRMTTKKMMLPASCSPVTTTTTRRVPQLMEMIRH